MTSKNTKTDHDTPSTAVDYSSGLDLMTYEGSAVQSPVYDSAGKVIGSKLISKAGVKSVVDVGSPERSLLLLKTVSGSMHGGGAFWNERAPDYLAIRQWIAEGAKGPSDD